MSTKVIKGWCAADEEAWDLCEKYECLVSVTAERTKDRLKNHPACRQPARRVTITVHVDDGKD